jgi:hypothetical protein
MSNTKTLTGLSQEVNDGFESTDIVPLAADQYTVGTSTKPYLNGYFRNLYTSLLSAFSGSISVAGSLIPSV